MAHAVSNIKKLGNSRIKAVYELSHREHKMKYWLAFSSQVLKSKS